MNVESCFASVRTCRGGTLVAAVLLFILGQNADIAAADPLTDREALERTISDLVGPYLNEAPAESGADDKPTSDEPAARPLAPNGRAWAIVVGIVTPQGRAVFGYGRFAADSGERPGSQTLFEIGSVTKTFTATLLADLTERGKIKLEDPVRLYLPESTSIPKRGEKEITLAHLATHTSGLPRIPLSIRLRSLVSNNPYLDYGADDLYKTLKRVELARDPGAEYEYSNLGYGLLGHALCREAGCTYEELVVERICRPLGLRDTRIELGGDQRKRFAPPYTASGTASSTWEFDALAGAGALRSTADDMLTYLEANMGITKSDLLPAMRRCHEARHAAGSKFQSVALGWHDEKMPMGARLVFHGGGTGGYSSLVGFIEESGQPAIGLAVLANAAPAATGGSVANDVAVKLLDLLQNESK